MLSRRKFVSLVAAGSALAVARPGYAFERDESRRDLWGPRLIDFFRRGDLSLIHGHLNKRATLVTLNTYRVGGQKVAFFGPKEVETALVSLRKNAMQPIYGPVFFKAGELLGPGFEGWENRLSILFAPIREVLDSEGGTGTVSFDVWYQSEPVEPGTPGLPSLLHMAVLPSA